MDIDALLATNFVDDAELPPSGSRCPLLTRLDDAESNPTSRKERILMQQLSTLSWEWRLTGRVKSGVFVVAEGKAAGRIVIVLGTVPADLEAVQKMELRVLMLCRLHFQRPLPVRTWWVTPKEPASRNVEDMGDEGNAKALPPLIELPVIGEGKGARVPPVHRDYLGHATFDDDAINAAISKAKRAFLENCERFGNNVEADARQRREALTAARRERWEAREAQEAKEAAAKPPPPPPAPPKEQKKSGWAAMKELFCF